jgi:hypothetical protein
MSDDRKKRLWKRMDEGHEMFYPHKSKDFYHKDADLRLVEIILSLADQNNVERITWHRLSKLNQWHVYFRFNESVDNLLFRCALIDLDIEYQTVGYIETTQIIIHNNSWEACYWQNL